MKSFLMASTAAAVLSLGFAAPAFADCTADIAALKAKITTGSVNSTDTAAPKSAGSTVQQEAVAAPAAVPTAPAKAATENQTSATATGAEAAGMAPDQVAAVNSAAASGNAVSAKGGTPGAGTLPGTEATAAMNKATEGIATSPAEVDAQQTAQPAETAPNAEQVAAADQPLAPPTSLSSGGKPVDMQATMLARAEAYQKLGNDGACMNLVEQAKAIQ